MTSLHCVLGKNTTFTVRVRRELKVCKVQNNLHANFFMFILLISNHTVFLVQLVSFSKSEITLAEVARAISAF